MPPRNPIGTGFASLLPSLTRAFCALILLGLVHAAFGAAWTWTGGGGNGNWNSGGNWNTGGAPASSATTDLTFSGSTNTGTALIPLNQNIASPFQLNTLRFSNTAGSFFLGGNSLAFTGAGNTITQDSTNAQSIANSIVASANATITLTLTGAGSGSATMSGAILTGSGNHDYAITKTGSVTFVLSGANSYRGATTISAGVLNIRHNTALGSTVSGTTVASGAALQIEGGITVGNEALTLNGGGITSDGALRNISGNNSFAGAITFGSASRIASDSGTLTLSGNLNNGGFLFTASGNGNVTMTGVISGAGGLTKTGTGTLTLSGAASNTYTGPTTVSQGTLVLAKPGSVLAPAITIGGAGSTATLQLGADLQLYGAATTINSQGVLNLNGFTDGVGVLTVSGGTVVTGAGTLYFSGGVVSNANSVTTTMAGNYSLYANQIFNIASGTTLSGVDVDVSGNVAEFQLNTTVTKQGTGKLVMSGTNSYTGLTTVSAGVLNIQDDLALGTTAGGTIVTSGAALQIQGGIAVGNEALTLNGNGIASDGALRNISGNNSYAGTITLGSASTVSSDAGTLTLSGGIVNGGFTSTFSGVGNIGESGVISGTGALVKNGTGTVTLSGGNTFAGSTTISTGILQVNTNNALGTAASGTTVANGAVLLLNNVSYTTAESLTLNGSGISNSGALRNSGTSSFAGAINVATSAMINAGGGNLTLSGGISKNGTTLTFAGGGTVNITTNGITGSSPNSDLVIDGTTVVLNAASSYNGPTTIQNSGTLQLGGNNVLPTAPQTAMTINTNSIFNVAGYNASIASLSGDSTAIVKNSVTGGTSTLVINPANGVTTTFAGTIAGTNGGTQGNIALQKNGTGTLILTGANTYGGSTTINGGTVTVADTTGSAMGSTSAVIVNSGGTLFLGASNQINNSATITLGGGTLAKGNFSEGTANTAGLGGLSLTSNSHIDFGLGSVGTLTFASFDSGFDLYTITIDNWSGAPGLQGSATTDRLIFASDQSAHLASFQFTGYGAAKEIDLGNGFYEIVPVVPEASTYAAGLLALLPILLHHRRQLKGFFSQRRGRIS
jgi:fibronectin-binding autotransporter adhesin